MGFNRLPEFYYQMGERYLPSAFDESLSILEKVNRMIAYLKEVADLNNSLIDYLNKFIEEFDEKLYNTVEDVLEKWLEDGKLFDLIDQAYGGMKKDFEQSFHYEELQTVEYDNPPFGKYYVTTIPTVDVHGNKIYLEKGYAHDSWCEGFAEMLETPRDYASRNATSLTINASVFDMTTEKPAGIHIKDGVVHKNTASDEGMWTLTYNKNTQELNSYPPNVDGNTLKNTYGATDAWSGFWPIIMNHVNTTSDVWGGRQSSIDKNPRQVIAQLDDKTIMIFTFRGREDDHEGYDYPAMQTVLQSFNVKFAYNLDGGGSTSTVKDNILINVPIDGNYGKERPVMDFISVIKPTSKAYEDFYKTLGDLSLIVRKLDARHISKYGDRIPGRLTFDDFFYIALDKAMYGYNETGDPKRILGLYTRASEAENARIYFGNIDTPMSIQASNNIIVTLGNNPESYRLMLNEDAPWVDVPLLNGWKHMSGRKLQYKKINAFETRIRGAVECGLTDLSGVTKKIAVLPIQCSPTQNMTIPVSILSGGREANDVIIYSNGDVVLRFPVTAPTATTAVQIEALINKET